MTLAARDIIALGGAKAVVSMSVYYPNVPGMGVVTPGWISRLHRVLSIMTGRGPFAVIGTGNHGLVSLRTFLTIIV
jgi:hypothetical protein